MGKHLTRIILFLASCNCLAQELYQRTSPSLESITQQRVYYYEVSEYQPLVAVKTIVPEAQNLTEPEHTVIAYFSAMMSGNYAWWLSLWDLDSVDAIKTREQARGITKENRLAGWKDGLDGKEIVLTHRIETGEFVIIRCRVFPETEESPRYLDIVLKRRDKEWYLTEALNGDPVLANWRDPDRELKVIVRHHIAPIKQDLDPKFMPPEGMSPCQSAESSHRDSIDNAETRRSLREMFFENVRVVRVKWISKDWIDFDSVSLHINEIMNAIPWGVDWGPVWSEVVATWQGGGIVAELEYYNGVRTQFELADKVYLCFGDQERNTWWTRLHAVDRIAPTQSTTIPNEKR